MKGDPDEAIHCIRTIFKTNFITMASGLNKGHQNEGKFVRVLKLQTSLKVSNIVKLAQNFKYGLFNITKQ